MSKPKGDGYVLVFAVVVCLVCSILLAVSESALKPYKEENVRIDKRFNILKALGVNVYTNGHKRIPPALVNEIYNRDVQELVLDGTTGAPVEGKKPADVNPDEFDARTKLPLYVRRDAAGKPMTYAFPVSGKGLWSTIYGYLALRSDLATVAGATFYKHGETPGLGGEVEAEWFQKNFQDKVVFKDGNRVRLRVIKGKVADNFPEGNPHAVDGISGATITGDGVTKFVNADLDRYENYFRTIRSK